MQDTELYRHLLGISSPWTISRVALDVAQQRVDVWAEHEQDRRWPCPELPQFMGVRSMNSQPFCTQAWLRVIEQLSPDSSRKTSWLAGTRRIRRQ